LEQIGIFQNQPSLPVPLTAAVERLRGHRKSREDHPTRQLLRAIRSIWFHPDRESNPSELPVNDLLTDSGNSD
jgi:hypothetical protein